MIDFVQPESDSLPPSIARRVDQVCDDFEHAWRNGTPPRIEDFLDGKIEPERTALLHELVLLDEYYRRQRQESPGTEDYQPRFPELAAAWLATALTPPEPAEATANSVEAAEGPASLRMCQRTLSSHACVIASFSLSTSQPRPSGDS